MNSFSYAQYFVCFIVQMRNANAYFSGPHNDKTQKVSYCLNTQLYIL